MAVLLLLVLTALFAPKLAPHNPNRQDLLALLQAPGARHWLGTDDLGRDVFSRLLDGGRVSLLVAFCSMTLGLAVGVPLGILASILGGAWDRAIMYVVDGILSFPSLLLALGLSSVLGPSITNTILAIGVVYAPRFTRFTRAQALAAKSGVYVEAARAAGAGLPRLMFRHILPNISSGLFVQASLYFGFAVITESSLSFIGAGVQPPNASWGSMLRDGFGYMDQAYWLAVAPGVTLAILVLASNLLGDAMRDVFDTRTRL